MGLQIFLLVFLIKFVIFTEVSELVYEIDSKSIAYLAWEFKSPLQYFIGRYASG